jgi:hypothetical protein
VHREIERLLGEKEAPMGGWVFVPMVNVLEVPPALSGRMRKPARRGESELSWPSWAFEGTTTLAGAFLRENA